MYGTQAWKNNKQMDRKFENDVKMYGTQATLALKKQIRKFENDVKMYGTQANTILSLFLLCLRMM